MQQAKQVCFYCFHKIWLLLAIGLVLLATLVSLLRLALPYADSYKHHLEHLIASQLGTQVQIAEISAGWQKLGPAMVLNQVQIGHPGQEVYLSIAQTRVRFDFWQSLRHWQLRAEHFELTGLRYAINSSSLLSGPAAEQGGSIPALDGLEQLFFRQLNHFTLLNSELVLSASDSDDLVIAVQKLDWRNDGERHQGIGELAVANVTANTFSFIIDLYGPTLDQAFGQIFLESRELDVLPWFRQWLPETGRLAEADINFQAWGRVDKGELQRFQIELAQNSLRWQRQGEARQLKLGPGQLLWVPEQQGWALYSSGLALSDGLTQWPDFQLQLHKDNAGWRGQLRQFTLDGMLPLSQLLSDEIPQLASLSRSGLQGELSQMQWQFNSREQWQLQGQLQQISSQSGAALPALSALQGQFWASATAAGLTLTGGPGELHWESMFSAPVAYQQLQLELLARQSRDGIWQVQLPQLQLQATDFNLSAIMQWRVQAEPELSLFAELTGASAANVSHYLPLRYLPQRVRDYLSDAVIDGEVTQARVLWQGPPGQFPFAGSEGIFQVAAEVNDASFRFDPAWPAVQQLHSQLWFENASMQIDTSSANIGGIALNGKVAAGIVDLFDAQYLNIQINSALELSQANQLISASPLAENLGKVLQQLAPAGAAQAQIGLQIGLRQPTVQAHGELTLNNVSLDLTAPELAIRQLSGQLKFKDDQISGRGLNFNWRDLAATAYISGTLQDGNYLFNLNASGDNASRQAMQALWPAAAELIDGNLDWQLALALQLLPDDVAYQATLDADLTATALLLPAPYTKTAAQSGKLQLRANGDSQQSLLALNYSDQLYFTAELEHGSVHIARANLSLGAANAGLHGAQFTIDIDLPYVTLLPWQQLLSEQLLSHQNDDNGLMPALSRVRGQIAKLELVAGSALNNTVFELEPAADSWQLRLHGTEIASRWVFSRQWQQQGLTADIDYLHLPYHTPPATEPPAALTALLPELQSGLLSMPPLTLTCNDCSIGNYRFGKVELQAKGQGDHWQLSQLRSRYKRNELDVQGDWQPDQQLGITRLQGRFKSPNLGALLHEFQLTAGISGSRADINFSLDWPAAPTQFDLALLNGQVDFSLGEGAFTEVSDQGARLFSIFSLDSLVRKLRLDFRDVFSKGFFYNRMSGALAIQRGVVQTSNTSIDGVPGNLAIQGYADLVSQQLDYQMSFSPKVTSSLPVIIAWMVNPVTGLAALALDEVFQSAEVISRINFTVTGSFEQPLVTEVNRHSTQVPVPVRIAQPEALINLEEQQPRGD
ncbi:hypothetical protein WG68_12435 [Arsukibacterium ikkense]|uniref:YhdP central domain-containing protein n=1 Tax=Arsukibacterium ikkense TaxID=336831 RepID=A0A0M2V3G1_9GAMM|nr:YhdP family protein [Arsukibacterium ikkense]KKO44949.1 hypothetical protein WG68_12435 [Arsukibacterium ikkense]